MVKPLLFHSFVCSPRTLGPFRPASFFVFCALLLSFSFSQTNEANTSADEPLTTKEGAHLQDIDGLAAIVGDKTIIPNSLKITAVAEDDGEIMGVSHKEYLIEGVQFHPESIMTDEGKKILENFIMRVKND